MFLLIVVSLVPRSLVDEAEGPHPYPVKSSVLRWCHESLLASSSLAIPSVRSTIE